MDALDKTVSIPAGFSDALRPVIFGLPNRDDNMFQSLLGFLMRCDHFQYFLIDFQNMVSIPAGFSDALRRMAFPPTVTSGWVSIPAGFSDALRQDAT